MTTYYVANSNGNDSNSGTSITAPWKTMSKVSTASNSMVPGDVVILLDGETWTASSIVVGASGSNGNPITFRRSYTGSTPPKIQNSGGDAISITAKNYIRMESLWLDGSANGVHVNTSSTGLEITYCTLSVMSNCGVRFETGHTGSGNFISHCEVHHCLNDGISFDGAATGYDVGWNYSHHIGSSYPGQVSAGNLGAVVAGSGDCFTAHGQTTGTIHHCVGHTSTKSFFATVQDTGFQWDVHHCFGKDFAYGGLIQGSASGVRPGTLRAWRNIMIAPDTLGIADPVAGTFAACALMQSQHATLGATMLLYHNVFVNPMNNANAYTVDGDVHAHSLTCKNNIFLAMGAASGRHIDVYIAGSAQPWTLAVDYNLFYLNTGVRFRYADASGHAVDWAAFKAATGLGTNDPSPAQPLLTGYARLFQNFGAWNYVSSTDSVIVSASEPSDFRLSAGSPGLDAALAINLGLSYDDLDFFNRKFPVGAAADIGACEHNRGILGGY